MPGAHETPFPVEAAERLLMIARTVWRTLPPGPRRDAVRGAGWALQHAIRVAQGDSLGQWSYAQAWARAEQAADTLIAALAEVAAPVRFRRDA